MKKFIIISVLLLCVASIVYLFNSMPQGNEYLNWEREMIQAGQLKK